MNSKSMTFYAKAQRNTKLDERDARGKQHDLPFILVEFTIALLCNRDGNLSSIHRHMENHHEKLVAYLGLESIFKKQYLALIYQYY